MFTIFLLACVLIKVVCNNYGSGFIYPCFVDICDDEMYCDSRSERCEHCSNLEPDCFTFKQYQNCTKYCMGVFKKSHIEKDCEALGKLQNGAHNGSIINKSILGEIVTSSCDHGFHPVGPTSTKCIEFGLWEHPLPKCEGNICEIPKEPKNGWIERPNDNLTQYMFGISIVYQCEDGMTLKSMCQADAKWSLGQPSCAKVNDATLYWQVATAGLAAVCLLLITGCIIITCKNNSTNCCIHNYAKIKHSTDNGMRNLSNKLSPKPERAAMEMTGIIVGDTTQRLEHCNGYIQLNDRSKRSSLGENGIQNENRHRNLSSSSEMSTDTSNTTDHSNERTSETMQSTPARTSNISKDRVVNLSVHIDYSNTVNNDMTSDKVKTADSKPISNTFIDHLPIPESDRVPTEDNQTIVQTDLKENIMQDNLTDVAAAQANDNGGRHIALGERNINSDDVVVKI